jgi:GTPase SAR1 family protein
MGAVLVYDVCSTVSFENMRRWINELTDHSSDDVVLQVVGNKTDLDGKEVS